MGYEKNIDRNNKSGKLENETLGKPYLLINGRMKGLHVIHAALKYLVGHRSIKVKEIITQAMILRLLLTSG